MRQLKSEELQAYGEFTTTNGINNEGSDTGEKNAQLFVTLIVDRWNKEINNETLTQALNILRQHISFLGHDKAEFNRLKMRMAPDAESLITQFLPYYHLSTEGSDFYINFSAVATWFLNHGQPITWENLNRLIGNVINQPNCPLVFVRKLQDSEKEALRIKTEDKLRHEQYLKDHPPSLEKKNPSFTDPKLEAHKEMMQRPAEVVKAFRETDPDIEWEKRCKSLIASITSNVDRLQAAQMFVEQTKGIASGRYEAAYKKLAFFVERRKVERSMAGR